MAWGIVYYRTRTSAVPTHEFLLACPTSVPVKLLAVIEAVRAAPPPAFSGGGKWEATSTRSPTFTASGRRSVRKPPTLAWRYSPRRLHRRLRRGRDTNVAAWAKAWEGAKLYLSVLTVGEIRKGIERLRPRDPQQADVFAAWLDELHERFGDRILPVDVNVAEDWGRLNAGTEHKTVDSLIAATARLHDLTVATRNVADFEDRDVRLLDPWQAPPQT